MKNRYYCDVCNRFLQKDEIELKDITSIWGTPSGDIKATITTTKCKYCNNEVFNETEEMLNDQKVLGRNGGRLNRSKEKNKELCNKYPFLIPHDSVTGKIIEDYDYDYTVLDLMPKGWNIAFGEEFVAELNEALGENKNNYVVTQVKEKFGELRWYDFGCTKEGYKVIDKYTRISKTTCVFCGKKATKVTKGYILPFCDDCFKLFYKNREEEPLYWEVKNDKIIYKEEGDE